MSVAGDSSSRTDGKSAATGALGPATGEPAVAVATAEAVSETILAEAPDKSALAGEYVLGTLDADDRANAHMLMAIDPDFAADIVRWERRLGELHVLVESVDPPPSNWEWIKARIATVQQSRQVWMPGLEEAAAAAARGGPAETPRRLPPPPAPQPRPAAAPAAPSMEPLLREEISDLTRRVRLWRVATFLVFLLAPLAIGAAVLRDQRPDLMPDALRPVPIVIEKPVEVIREVVREVASPRIAEYVAVFPAAGPSGVGFLLTIDAERRIANIRRVDASVPADGVDELWITTGPDAAPQSLGVIDGDPFTVREALADFDVVALRNATFGISHEPKGGSPNGRPSGLLAEARLIQATPEAFPSATP